jgi:hypothetical protein
MLSTQKNVMEIRMKQAFFTMLLILVSLCPGSSFGMSQQIPVETDIYDMKTGSTSEQPLTSDQSLPEMSMIVSQSQTGDKLDKQSHDKYQDKHHTYKCFDNCIESRVHCERYIVTQKGKEVGMVGSKENNEWSRNCQIIYTICIDKCKK